MSTAIYSNLNSNMEAAVSGAVVFDYGLLPSQTAADLQEHAAAIRNGLKQQLASVIEAGRRLAAVKEALQHGDFGAWITAEFGWKIRTAQQYMLAAETYAGKAHCVAHLPLGILYRLQAPSVPTGVREEVFQRLDKGETLVGDEINSILLEAREVKRREAEAHSKTPAQRQREQRRRERLKQEFEADKVEREAVAAREKTASTAAADLIHRAMPEKIADLLSLLEAADPWSFVEELKNGGRA